MGPAAHAASASSQPPSDLGNEMEETQVIQAEAARAKALVDVDVAGLRDMTAEDYTHVESNGKYRTRDQFLKGLEDADYRFKTFVLDRIQVRVEGKVAIATGDYHNDIMTHSGLMPTKYARFIRVWMFQGKRWVNVAHQATEFKLS